MFNLSTPDLAAVRTALANDAALSHRSGAFKDIVRIAAFVNQFGTCCYCGLEITSDVSRMPDVEHFAHKSKYGSWAKLPVNLLLACKQCNQTQKGTYDTVRVVVSTYENCQFWLVHPYIDDVPNHIIGGFCSIVEAPSIPIPRTLKGARTIRLFNLQSVPKLEEWDRLHRRHMRKAGYTIDQNVLFEKAIQELSAYGHPSRF